LKAKSLQENECSNDSTTTQTTNFHYAKPQATPWHTITVKIMHTWNVLTFNKSLQQTSSSIFLSL